MSAASHVPKFGDAYRDAYLRTAVRRSRLVLRRRVLRILGFLALGFAAAVAAAVTVPVAFGFQSFTVLSGSMEPAIGTGDVVVVRRIAPLDATIRDVVSFRSPDDPAKVITHRVTGMRVVGDSVNFVTRGDANTGSERWAVPTSGTIGRVEYRIPKLGYVTNRIGSPFGRLGFLVVPAILLAIFELRRIWRPTPDES